MITNIRVRQTKRGDRIGVLSLDDGTSQIEVVCFSEPFNKFRSLLVEDQLVIIEGDVSIDDFNNGVRMVAREVYTIDQAREKFAKYLKIKLHAKQSLDLEQLKLFLQKHNKGKCGVVVDFLYGDYRAEIKLGNEWLVQPTGVFLGTLSSEFMLQDVEVVY